MFKKLFSPREPDATLTKSWKELALKQDANMAWGLGSGLRWDADQDDGTIRFTLRGGREAVAAFQVVGSFNPSERSWLWAWDNATILPDLARHAELCREFGERHQLSMFTEGKVICSKDDALRFTALAVHLADAVGAYFSFEGSPHLFMTFGEVTFRDIN